MQTVGIAVLMGGGPAMVYGCKALEVPDQLEAAGLKAADAGSIRDRSHPL